ncbi:MAG: hypothetical protein HYT46_01365 [Candidatus Vogelbacteria bacterium]|nr:hypothetical protein [Candidatus Vogelbacteria bacterium]
MKNRGVALLYAVLLVSIVLTISLSLLNITFKQIVLTAVSRESQVAHFNAWSAVDCILMANQSFNDPDPYITDDTDNNPFGVFKFFSTPPFYSLEKSTPPWSIGALVYTCGNGSGNDISINVGDPSGDIARIGFGADGIESNYKLTGSGLNGGCAIVTVAKIGSEENYDNFPGENEGDTDEKAIMVSALGYNSVHPCADPPETSSRQVERRIRIKTLAG